MRLRDECRHPRRTGGGRTAHPQLRIDALERTRGRRVQREIGGLIGALPESSQVRLVPHLEIPAAHFFLAVALAQVAHKGIDQRGPLVQPWVGGVALPVEDVLVGGLHRLRGKPQFDEGAYAHAEQAVVQAVDPAPVIARAPANLAVCPQHVMEDRVEADIAEPEFVPRGVQLRQAVLAEQRARIVRADRQVVEAIARRGRPPHVQRDRARRGWRGDGHARPRGHDNGREQARKSHGGSSA